MRTSATLDRERFSELFEAHYAQVQAFAVRRVGRDLADEVTAETFLVAWRRLDAVPVQPLPWLYGVARNMIARELADSAKQAKATRLIARERLGPALEDDCEHEPLWEAWEQLTDSDREILSLVVWDELPVRDAARVLRVPTSVFSVRLHRARRRLERHLRQAAVPGTPAVREATR
ncbi:MAG: RNA polymerase sigma factor [Solirubrobacteraceae bacterium]